MSDDRNDQPSGDRPAPEIEDRRALHWLMDRDSGGAIGDLPFTNEDRHEFRPILRPPVPVLTALDDSTQQRGESVRLRGETFTIGRSSGDLILPNDPAISGLHAEIRRVPRKGNYQWQLVDLSSVNGTFVRAVRASLHGEAIVIIGARRFRLRNPLVANRQATQAPVTRMIDSTGLPATVWPVLAETAQRSPGIEVPLKADSVSIGRAGGGADIQLDDPLVADRHAQLERQRDGSWRIVAETTRNGIWVSITTVTLTTFCHFRCGEQLFRFEIP